MATIGRTLHDTRDGHAIAAETLVNGDILMFNSDGKVEQIDDLGAGRGYAGICGQAAVAGDEIALDGGVAFFYPYASAALADVGVAAYASGAGTIAKTSVNNLYIGMITDVEVGVGWYIDPLAVRPSAAAGGLLIAKGSYDFAVDTGAQAVYSLGAIIPAGAIIKGLRTYEETEFTSGGSATILFKAGSTSLTGALAFNTAFTAGIDSQTLATAGGFKLAAASELTMTIGAADLTAGKIQVYAEYYMS